MGMEKLEFGLEGGVRGRMFFRYLYFTLNRDKELVFTSKLSLL